MTYIVNCEVTEISDTDQRGQIILKPVVNKTSYAKIFKTKEEVLRFLIGELAGVPTVQVSDDVRAV